MIGIADPYRQEAPKAFVKLKPGAAPTFEEMKTHLATRKSQKARDAGRARDPCRAAQDAGRQALQEGTQGGRAHQGPSQGGVIIFLPPRPSIDGEGSAKMRA